MPKAILVQHDKFHVPGGGIIEIKIWRLPRPTPERPHGLKYSLFFGFRGERIVGYDNERGKGDHRHSRNREYAYSFVSIEKLLHDFRSDVELARKELGK